MCTSQIRDLAEELYAAMRLADVPRAVAEMLEPQVAAALARAYELGLQAGRRVLDPPPPPEPPKRWGKTADLSAEDFAQDIIACVGDGQAVDVHDVLLRIKRRRRCHKLAVNGRPAALQEIRQMAARLAREGKLALNGDSLGAA